MAVAFRVDLEYRDLASGHRGAGHNVDLRNDDRAAVDVVEVRIAGDHTVSGHIDDVLAAVKDVTVRSHDLDHAVLMSGERIEVHIPVRVRGHGLHVQKIGQLGAARQSLVRDLKYGAGKRFFGGDVFLYKELLVGHGDRLIFVLKISVRGNRVRTIQKRLEANESLAFDQILCNLKRNIHHAAAGSGQRRRQRLGEIKGKGHRGNNGISVLVFDRSAGRLVHQGCGERVEFAWNQIAEGHGIRDLDSIFRMLQIDHLSRGISISMSSCADCREEDRLVKICQLLVLCNGLAIVGQGLKYHDAVVDKQSRVNREVQLHIARSVRGNEVNGDFIGIGAVVFQNLAVGALHHNAGHGVGLAGDQILVMHDILELRHDGRFHDVRIKLIGGRGCNAREVDALILVVDVLVLGNDHTVQAQLFKSDGSDAGHLRSVELKGELDRAFRAGQLDRLGSGDGIARRIEELGAGGLVHQSSAEGVGEPRNEIRVADLVFQLDLALGEDNLASSRVGQRRFEIRDLHGLILVVKILVDRNNDIQIVVQLLESNHGLAEKTFGVKGEGHIDCAVRSGCRKAGLADDFVAVLVQHGVAGGFVHQLALDGVILARRQRVIGYSIRQRQRTGAEDDLGAAVASQSCANGRNGKALIRVVDVLMCRDLNTVAVQGLINDGGKTVVNRGVKGDRNVDRAACAVRRKGRLFLDGVAVGILERITRFLVDQHGLQDIRYARDQVLVVNGVGDRGMSVGEDLLLAACAGCRGPDLREVDTLVFIVEILVLGNDRGAKTDLLESNCRLPLKTGGVKGEGQLYRTVSTGDPDIFGGGDRIAGGIEQLRTGVLVHERTREGVGLAGEHVRIGDHVFKSDRTVCEYDLIPVPVGKRCPRLGDLHSLILVVDVLMDRNDNAKLVLQVLESNQSRAEETFGIEGEGNFHGAVRGSRAEGLLADDLITAAVCRGEAGGLVHQLALGRVGVSGCQILVCDGVRQRDRTGAENDLLSPVSGERCGDIRNSEALAGIVHVLVFGDLHAVAEQGFEHDGRDPLKALCVERDRDFDAAEGIVRGEGGLFLDRVATSVLERVAGVFIDQSGLQDISNARDQVLILNRVDDRGGIRRDQLLFTGRAGSGRADRREVDRLVGVVEVVADIHDLGALVQRDKGNDRLSGKPGSVKGELKIEAAGGIVSYKGLFSRDLGASNRERRVRVAVHQDANDTIGVSGNAAAIGDLVSECDRAICQSKVQIADLVQHQGLDVRSHVVDGSEIQLMVFLVDLKFDCNELKTCVRRATQLLHFVVAIREGAAGVTNGRGRISAREPDAGRRIEQTRIDRAAAHRCVIPIGVRAVSVGCAGELAVDVRDHDMALAGIKVRDPEGRVGDTGHGEGVDLNKVDLTTPNLLFERM